MDEPGRHPASARKLRRLRAAGDLVPVGDLLSPARLAVTAALVLLAGRAALGALAAPLRRALVAPELATLGELAGALRPLALGSAAALLALALLPAGLAWLARGAPWVLRAPGLPGSALPRLRAGRAAGALLKSTAALGVAALLLPGLARALVSASSPGALAQATIRGLGGGLLLVVGVAGLSGLLAHGAERWGYARRIAMTDLERRREIAEDQGGPAARQARDRARELLLSQPVPASQAAPRERVGDLARPSGGEP